MILDDLRLLLKPVVSRVKGIVTKGILESVDDSKDIQLVKYTGLDGEVVSGAERMQPAGIASHPTKGSSLIVLANNGSKDHPVVIVVDDGASRPKVANQKDRTFYDEWGNKVVMTEDGISVIDNQGNTITMNSGGISLNGDSKSFVTQAELQTTIDTFMAQLNAHTHITTATVGATAVLGVIAPPTVSMTFDSSASATTTVKTGG